MTTVAPASPAPRRRRLTTAGEVCQEFLDRMLSGDQRTQRNGGGNVRSRRVRIQKFAAVKGAIAVDDLIADDLERWIEDNTSEWKSAWSKRNIAQLIKQVFCWAWKKGLIDRHPFAGVTYRQGDRRDAMTEAQFRLILRNTSVEYRRALLFLWWTGCRPKELCDLKWEFIDTEKAIAVLKEHKTKHSRKDRADRVICLPEKAIRLLDWMLDDQRGEQEYIFLNRHGNRWHRAELDRRLCRLRSKLGIPMSVKLYGCRHSFGTRLAVANVELKTLSTLMGHSNTLQTEHYIHMAREVTHLHEALEQGLAHKKEPEK